MDSRNIIIAFLIIFLTISLVGIYGLSKENVMLQDNLDDVNEDLDRSQEHADNAVKMATMSRRAAHRLEQQQLPFNLGMFSAIRPYGRRSRFYRTRAHRRL